MGEFLVSCAQDIHKYEDGSTLYHQQFVYKFPNGYGVSVIRFSKNGDHEDVWETAVLNTDGNLLTFNEYDDVVEQNLSSDDVVTVLYGVYKEGIDYCR